MIDTKVLSLGGSIIAPQQVDVSFLKGFRTTILEYLAGQEGRRIILVCGGGGPAREYQRAFRELLAEQAAEQSEAQDWIGIAATRLNAELLRQLFQPLCPGSVITDPTAVSIFPGRVMVAAGWKPGFSTDYDAVLLAERFQAARLLNLSNIARVYSADPRDDPDAAPIDRIDWAGFREIVGDTWVPGANLPFDPVASAHAAQLGLEVIVAAGQNLDNLRKILEGEPFEGTVIGPD